MLPLISISLDNNKQTEKISDKTFSSTLNNSNLSNANDQSFLNNNPNIAKFLIPTDVKIGSTRRLKDYEILATACRRAGKNRVKIMSAQYNKIG